ncbi:hypothetical protein [Nostoc sp.]|uniref:hypothetical protein n=1 Tax=Nostoc sp. TaxID=1180 RepID=UPI002FF6A62F
MPTATIPLQLNLQILGRITVSYIYHTSLFIDEQDLDFTFQHALNAQYFSTRGCANGNLLRRRLSTSKYKSVQVPHAPCPSRVLNGENLTSLLRTG